MAKRNKKRSKRIDRTTTKSGKQLLSGQSSQQVKLKRYAIWSISGLIAIAAIVVAWTFFQNILHNTSDSTSMNQPQAAVPAANWGTDNNSVSGGPQINFPETEYDFGTIAQGSKVSHTFVVRNAGDAPLRLIKAQGT